MMSHWHYVVSPGFLIPTEAAMGGPEEGSLLATCLANQNKVAPDRQRHLGDLLQPHSWCRHGDWRSLEGPPAEAPGLRVT